MSKAILTFNLNNHEDKMDHLRCVKSLDMAIALFEITSYLHSMDNFDKKPKLDDINKKIWEIIENNDIDLDNLVC